MVMTHLHAKYLGQSVHKIECIETDGQTDRRSRRLHYLDNAVGKKATGVTVFFLTSFLYMWTR